MTNILPTLPVAELIIRAIIVYLFVLGLLRLVGRRHVGEMAPFDLVVLLLISECVQGSLTGSDSSVIGGVISVTALLALSHLTGYLTSRNKVAERILEGNPRVLVRHGRVLDQALAEEHISRSELMEALRREGHASLARVHYAVLENNGKISFGFKSETQSATKKVKSKSQMRSPRANLP